MDEVKPSQYESYVDDGNDSFDVAMSVNKAGVIIKSICDCEDGNKTFCVHKTAVLISIAEKRKVGSKIVKVKANQTQLLLQDVDTEKLKNWVWELLLKNKDLEMAFVHQFSEKQQTFTTAEIIKITTDATKAITKNKKYIEISELKKLVDLWQGIHLPIINQYLSDVTNETYFNNLHALLVTVKTYNDKINSNSVKIDNYTDDIYQKIRNAILALMEETAWLKAIKHFLHKSDDSLDLLKDDCFKFLTTLIPLENESRKIILSNFLAKTHEQSIFSEDYFVKYRQPVILDIVISVGLFNKYFKMFKPYGYENEYNLKLIKMLIENDEIKIAENFCNQQIASNYYEQYNIPYLVLLKDIYKKTNNKKLYNELQIKLLPTTFDFEDYKEILENFNGDLLKKDFRTNTLTKAKRASQNGRIEATSFCFRLMDEEKAFTKMIGLINNSIHYSFIITYFEQMFLANKESLMLALLNKNNNIWGGMNSTDREIEKYYFLKLYELMVLHYGKNTVALELRAYCSKWIYNRTNFIQFLKLQIDDEYREN